MNFASLTNEELLTYQQELLPHQSVSPTDSALLKEVLKRFESLILKEGEEIRQLKANLENAENEIENLLDALDGLNEREK